MTLGKKNLERKRDKNNFMKEESKMEDISMSLGKKNLKFKR